MVRQPGLPRVLAFGACPLQGGQGDFGGRAAASEPFGRELADERVVVRQPLHAGFEVRQRGAETDIDPDGAAQSVDEALVAWCQERLGCGERGIEVPARVFVVRSRLRDGLQQERRLGRWGAAE
ncbi:MAG: hypothetical protein ACO3UM_03385, partial [Planctomycetota bacterium]